MVSFCLRGYLTGIDELEVLAFTYRIHIIYPYNIYNTIIIIKSSTKEQEKLYISVLYCHTLVSSSPRSRSGWAKLVMTVRRSPHLQHIPCASWYEFFYDEAHDPFFTSPLPCPFPFSLSPPSIFHPPDYAIELHILLLHL